MSEWPSLPLSEWRDTQATLHLWTQVVGKIRLALGPRINHWWGSTLYVTARGLTTSAMHHRGRTLEINFDFVDHELDILCDDARVATLPLRPMSVAAFHHDLMNALLALELDVKIWPMPVEIPDPIRFDQDHQHASYDADAVQRFWRILVQSERVMQQFRARYVGKSSPVHFFWGSFDLAVTRFSGRRAPDHPGIPGVADFITREAYSHEVSSAGFWPGGGPIDEPAYYAYAYPEPKGYREWKVKPAAATYSTDFGEFILPYEAVRTAADPEATLMEFLESTYAGVAELGGWERGELEK